MTVSPTAQANLMLLTRMPAWLIKSGWAPGFGYFVRLFHSNLSAMVPDAILEH